MPSEKDLAFLILVATPFAIVYFGGLYLINNNLKPFLDKHPVTLSNSIAIPPAPIIPKSKSVEPLSTADVGTRIDGKKVVVTKRSPDGRPICAKVDKNSDLLPSAAFLGLDPAGFDDSGIYYVGNERFTRADFLKNAGSIKIPKNTSVCIHPPSELNSTPTTQGNLNNHNLVLGSIRGGTVISSAIRKGPVFRLSGRG